MQPETGPPTRDYSANIRIEVARANRRQREVARAADIPWSTWSSRMRIPESSRLWRADELDRIAAALGIPAEKLRGAS